MQGRGKHLDATDVREHRSYKEKASQDASGVKQEKGSMTRPRFGKAYWLMSCASGGGGGEAEKKGCRGKKGLQRRYTERREQGKRYHFNSGVENGPGFNPGVEKRSRIFRGGEALQRVGRKTRGDGDTKVVGL